MKTMILETVSSLNVNLRNPTNHARSPRRFLLIPLILVCCALSPQMQALTPPPDGGYPNGNTAEGDGALSGLTSGFYNSAVGFLSLLSNTEGNFNTAIGAGALLSNGTGSADTVEGVGPSENTAIGAGALFSNTIGGANTASGTFALFSNTIGAFNTAIGDAALFANTTGGFNTATGDSALLSNTTGNFNTANGLIALNLNTTGDSNTAIGSAALFSNIDGNDNTAIGAEALSNNMGGFQNTAIGSGALFNNTTGSNNTAIGLGALASTTGQGNIGVGAFAGQNITTGDFNICIFSPGVAGDDSTIRIGDATHTATYIGGISGATASGGVAVFVAADGKLGTLTSSARFKDGIRPMDKASEAILALKPVTFRYKRQIDPVGTPQFGLVAEDVEKVNPDLVVRDKEGRPYSVRYDQVNAMLLNEFLKEHNAFVEEQHKVQKLEAIVVNLVTTVKEQATQIQKVSARLELRESVPRTVVND
jgi:hypothetical protein